MDMNSLICVIFACCLIFSSLASKAPNKIIPKPELGVAATDRRISNLANDYPEGQGLFLVGEKVIQYQNCGILRDMYNLYTNQTSCVMKHFDVYMHGKCIGVVGVVDLWTKELDIRAADMTVNDFLKEHSNILIVQHFNPDDKAYSEMAVANFIERFKTEHPSYTLSTVNCQKFAVDFSYHFFDVKISYQRKFLRRLAQFGLFVVAPAVAAVSWQMLAMFQ